MRLAAARGRDAAATLTEPDVVTIEHLEFEPILDCEFAGCAGKHQHPAVWRVLTTHDVRTHGPQVRLICDPCYRFLVEHPTAIAVCPVHGYVCRLREWWTLLGPI